MSDLHSYFKPRRDRKKKLLLGAVDREQHRLGMRMVADFLNRMVGGFITWCDGFRLNSITRGSQDPCFTFMTQQFGLKHFQVDLISGESGKIRPGIPKRQIEQKS